jgi:hypothetical protein
VHIDEGMCVRLRDGRNARSKLCGAMCVVQTRSFDAQNKDTEPIAVAWVSGTKRLR